MKLQRRTRIPYRKTNKEGVFESPRLLSERNGAIYMAIIDLNEGSYKIRNCRSRVLTKSSKKENKVYKSPVALKRRVKQLLKQLGVRFDLDIRRIK